MPLPLVGMGTAEHPFDPERTKSAVLTAIGLGYRHFDTAAFNQSEKPLGDAIVEATSLGLIGSREEVFVTSKLWCTDCHPELVLPAIKASLRSIQFYSYVNSFGDLSMKVLLFTYLLHCVVS